MAQSVNKFDENSIMKYSYEVTFNSKKCATLTGVNIGIHFALAA